jgi:hypothetical protein
MSAVAPGGSGGGRKPTGPPKKNPDYRPGRKDDDDDEEEQFNRLFCAVCNKYLRVGQTLRNIAGSASDPAIFMETLSADIQAAALGIVITMISNFTGADTILESSNQPPWPTHRKYLSF